MDKTTSQKNLAFVFPGQGSQSVGMLDNLAEQFPEVQQTFGQASEALGHDLWQLVHQGPEDSLNQTQNTQPAMLAAGVVVWRVWQAQGGPMPALMAGHSLGEYSALVCAEVLDFPAAIRLVADRARFMQEAVPAGEGAIAAILGISDVAVAQLCEQQAHGEVLVPVNYNSPGQVVIAGQTAAVQRAVEAAPEAGAKRAVILPVSVPVHCSLMQQAGERMEQRLREVKFYSPQIPVLHNVHVQAETDPDAIRQMLVRQISSPVRWVETIQHMAEQGITRAVECGPGKILTGLNKRINRDLKTLPVYDAASLEAALAGIAGSTP